MFGDEPAGAASAALGTEGSHVAIVSPGGAGGAAHPDFLDVCELSDSDEDELDLGR